eukprot:g25804.t1
MAGLEERFEEPEEAVEIQVLNEDMAPKTRPAEPAALTNPARAVVVLERPAEGSAVGGSDFSILSFQEPLERADSAWLEAALQSGGGVLQVSGRTVCAVRDDLAVKRVPCQAHTVDSGWTSLRVSAQARQQGGPWWINYLEFKQGQGWKQLKSFVRGLARDEDPRAVYFALAAPMSSFGGHVAAWPSALMDQEMASVAVARAHKWRSGLQEDCEQKHTSINRNVKRLTLFSSETEGVSNAVQEAGSITLLAELPVEDGEELTISYYPEADFLDIFEAYGFFDETCLIHTAELPLSLHALRARHGVLGGRQERLLEALAPLGYDADLEAWWLPDFKAEESPLWRAARVLVLEEEELFDVDLLPMEEQLERLKAPVRREEEAQAFLSRLLHAHLARLDVPQPESAECAADASAVAAAERLRSFETELLKGGLVEAAEGFQALGTNRIFPYRPWLQWLTLAPALHAVGYPGDRPVRPCWYARGIYHWQRPCGAPTRRTAARPSVRAMVLRHVWHRCRGQLLSWLLLVAFAYSTALRR